MTEAVRSVDIISQTEELADKILANKQELTVMDKRRQENREALRVIEKSDEPKVWITVGSMLVKMKRTQAIELIKKDQQQIEQQINLIYSEQKILVNKHRDVEFKSPFSGTNLKPLDRKEFSALKANLPML
ncbi:p53 and DNA damage-regulated protein 1 [Drosophila albomicans]|uniref:p53 and DNA damage-regulated protein 1 n=1 Tax=Drosophila albomicans TaxID=7291 RepID=A0A6P8YQQ7_DROAB|nr:p53 and DNA damage-regulated protein 1 [Drosophila albomicans]